MNRHCEGDSPKQSKSKQSKNHKFIDCHESALLQSTDSRNDIVGESSLRDLLVSRGNPNKSKISPSLANGDSFKFPPPLRRGIKGAGKIQSLRDLLANSANP